MLLSLFTEPENIFRDNFFEGSIWPAPCMTDPEEIKTRISLMQLEDKTIGSMRFVGMSYSHQHYVFEQYALNASDTPIDDETLTLHAYDMIDPDTRFERLAVIDEPFMIRFDEGYAFGEGNTFEIDTPEAGMFCCSMTTIPWSIKSKTGPPNIDADVLFSPCLSKNIVDVEVATYTTDTDPMFGNHFDEEYSERELVSSITLWTDSGCGIRVKCDVDYCIVSCVDCDGEIMTIPFRELRPALFTWEDMHVDMASGFIPDGSTFFFGEKGSYAAEPIFATIAPEGEGSSMCISLSEFILFELAITMQTGKYFDYYTDYTFSSRQWVSMLDTADRILNFKRFDDLFDYLTGCNVLYHNGENVFRSILNKKGADFWEHKDKYITQLSDMRRWTKLVLRKNGVMKIYGF